MKRTLSTLVMILLVLAGAVPLWAADGVTVSTAIKRQVEVINDQGEKEIVLEDVESAVPGEELVILITYTNTGEVAAENIAINNPLSDQMVYTAGSAEGEDTRVTYSVDGGRSFDAPGNLVVEENGETRPAEPADYTHILWKRTVPLDPGQTASVRFRAVIR